MNDLAMNDCIGRSKCLESIALTRRTNKIFTKTIDVGNSFFLLSVIKREIQQVCVVPIIMQKKERKK